MRWGSVKDKSCSEVIIHSIKLRSHVGSDDVLHLQVPVGLQDADIEVTHNAREFSRVEGLTIEDWEE